MLTFAEIQKINAERARKEREDDARRLADYQADCLASWAGREKTFPNAR